MHTVVYYIGNAHYNYFAPDRALVALFSTLGVTDCASSLQSTDHFYSGTII